MLYYYLDMKKINILFLLFLISTYSSSVYAEWKHLITEPNGTRWFLNIGDVKKIDGYVYLWWLTDWKKPTQSGDLSAMNHIMCDCKFLKYKYIRFIFFKGQLGQDLRSNDEPVEQLKGWQYAPPDSAHYILLKTACANVL